MFHLFATRIEGYEYDWHTSDPMEINNGLVNLLDNNFINSITLVWIS